MLDSPTQPLAARISPEAVRQLRRTTRARHGRQRDLDSATLGQALDRGEAVAICARMSAWCDRTPDEAHAVRELMRRHGITRAQIVASQRAQDIPVEDVAPLRRDRRH